MTDIIETAQEKYERLMDENECYVEKAIKAGIVPEIRLEHFKATLEAFKATCNPAPQPTPTLESLNYE